MRGSFWLWEVVRGWISGRQKWNFFNGRSNLSQSANRILDESKRKRIAIGTFDQLDAIPHALANLASQELTSTKVILLADQGSVADELDKKLASDETTKGTSSPAILTRGTREAGDMRSASPDVKDSSIPEEYKRIVEFEKWIAPPLADRLNQKLTEGACLLFAVVSIPDLEQMVCRVLIEHSVGQVQVHDFLFE